MLTTTQIKACTPIRHFQISLTNSIRIKICTILTNRVPELKSQESLAKLKIEGFSQTSWLWVTTQSTLIQITSVPRMATAAEAAR